jgi:hypothetical protein
LGTPNLSSLPLDLIETVTSNDGVVTQPVFVVIVKRLLHVMNECVRSASSAEQHNSCLSASLANEFTLQSNERRRQWQLAQQSTQSNNQFAPWLLFFSGAAMLIIAGYKLSQSQQDARQQQRRLNRRRAEEEAALLVNNAVIRIVVEDAAAPPAADPFIITGYPAAGETDLEKLLRQCRILKLTKQPWYTELEKWDCPITYQLPQRPVICNIDRTVYDLAAITRHLRDNRANPAATTPMGVAIDRPVELIRASMVEELLISAIRPQVQPHLHQLEDYAAIKIQAVTRGFLARKSLAPSDEKQPSDSDVKSTGLRRRHC